MDAKKPPTKAQESAGLVTAWPRSAQLTLTFLLGVTTTLIAIHAYGSSRWGTKPTVLPHRIDLNRADRSALLQLPHVGEKTAEKIDDFRREHGPFQSVDELAQVPGIGPAKLEQLRSYVCVRPEDVDEDYQQAPMAEVSNRSTKKKSGLAGKGPAERKSGNKKAAALKKPIDVNSATEGELCLLPGVGPATAKAILKERDKGPFRTVEELTRVPGIKAKKLDALKPYLIVGNASAHEEPADGQ